MWLSPGCPLRVILFSGVCVLVACAAGSKAPTPVAPTRVPAPVLTPSPVSTVAPPATPTAIPSATAPPTPTPVPPYSKLSGRVATSADTVQLRPLIVKIDNASPARPQSGLSDADIVFETLTEGNITRFAAVFQSAEPDPIGPIRSARLSDLDIPYQFDGILVHIGATQALYERLRQVDFPDLDLFYSGPFNRRPDRPAPHNVYSTAASLREYSQQHGWARPVSSPGYRFYWGEPPALPGGKPDAYVALNYASYSRSEYVYDPGRGGYLRFTDGAPHFDRNTGEQILARNVVVQFVRTWLTDIVEDANGARSMDFELVGEGQAMVFRDGQVATGTWVRKSKTGLTQYLDERGSPFVFKPGNLWIHLVDRAMTVDFR